MLPSTPFSKTPNTPFQKGRGERISQPRKHKIVV